MKGVSNIKPYLRPTSSMTEDERNNLKAVACPNGTGYFNEQYLVCPINHFGEQISFDFMSDIITNEFYFMNDSFIASSQILKAIKDNAFGGSSSYLTTRFSKSPGSGRVWQWGDDFVINYEANSLISYSVNLAFKRLAQSSFNA